MRLSQEKVKEVEAFLRYCVDGCDLVKGDDGSLMFAANADEGGPCVVIERECGKVLIAAYKGRYMECDREQGHAGQHGCRKYVQPEGVDHPARSGPLDG